MLKDFFSQITGVDSTLLNKMEKYDPMSHLIAKAVPTEIPQVFLYKKPIIEENKSFLFLITGPSGAGKETAVQRLENSGKVTRIISATSRQKRPNEPETDYVWMRAKRDDESDEEFEEHLVQEYDLLESNRHHGEVYGLPRASLNNVRLEQAGIVHTDNNGAKTLTGKLDKAFNIVVFFVTAKNYETLWTRMKDRNNKEKRISKAVEEIADAPNIANFYILNDGTIEELQNATEDIIKTFYEK